MRGVALAVALCVATPALAGDRGSTGDGTSDGGAIDDRVLLDRDVLDPPELDVRAYASAAEVLLGTPFSLFVAIAHPADVEVSVPASLSLGNAFELGRRTVSRSRRPDGMRIKELELEVIAWEVGEHAIPPIPVTYARHGIVHAVPTPAVPLVVIGLAGEDDSEIRDVRAPVPVMEPVRIGVYAAVAVAALLAVALALRLIRRTGHRAAPQATPPPDREALARLDALAASLDRDREASFLAMSEIVRAYLGQRFGVPATDATSTELQAALAARQGTEAVRTLLAPWLERCDLVKYAGATATLEDTRHALDTARRIIEITRPAEAEHV